MLTASPLMPSPWPVRGVERQAVGNFPLGGLAGERQFLQRGVSFEMTAQTAPREIPACEFWKACCLFLDRELEH
jgi:hypothetical protein